MGMSSPLRLGTPSQRLKQSRSHNTRGNTCTYTHTQIRQIEAQECKSQPLHIICSIEDKDSSYIGLLQFWSFGWGMIGGVPPVPICSNFWHIATVNENILLWYHLNDVLESPPKLIELAARPLHIVHHVPDHPCKAYMFITTTGICFSWYIGQSICFVHIPSMDDMATFNPTLWQL